MEYTVKDIQRLRKTTGAGPLECKQALQAARSFEEAITTVEARGKKRAETIGDQNHETCQGYIAAYIHFTGRLGALVELQCSTDFVSRTEAFRHLADELALQVAVQDPTYLTVEEIPAVVAEGKAHQELEALALMSQPWCKDEQATIADLVQDLARKTGEHIVVRRFARFQLGEERQEQDR